MELIFLEVGSMLDVSWLSPEVFKYRDMATRTQC